MWRREAVRRGCWSRGPASALQHGSLAGRGALATRRLHVFPVTRHLGLPSSGTGDAPKMTVPMLRTRAGMEAALSWTRTRETSRSSVIFGRPQLRAYAASSRKTDPLVAAAQGGKSARQPKARKGAAWWKSSEQDFNKGTKAHSADSIEIAVRDQNIKLLEKIATQNADIVQRRDNLLMIACLYRGRKLMETLLRRGEDPNYKNAISCTPLHYCCSHDFARGVALLLSYDANIEVHDENGLTPLHQAVVANSVECTQLLIEHGARLHSEDIDGDQPLHSAARVGSYETANLLIEKGADVNSKNSKGESPLHLAVSTDEGKLAMLLLEKGASLGSRDHNGLTPLHRAAQNSDDKSCVPLLIKHGAEVNDSLSAGISPLHFAAYSGNLDATARLVDAGALIEEKTHEGFNALMIAAQEGHLGCLSYLAKAGAYLDNRNNEGLAALHLAVAGNHAACAEMLIKKGADVNIKDINRLTPLHLAAQNEKDDPTIVQLLLNHGADVNASTPEDAVTPLHAAIDHDNIQIATLLLQQGADPHQAETNGVTPLHLAISAELPEIVEVLCDLGVDVNVKDPDGRSPLKLAQEMESEQMVELLKRYGAK